MPTDPDTDLRNAHSLLQQGQLDEAVVTTPGRPVVIDMAQLTYIDSSGIGFLVQTYQATGERVVICNPSRQVRRILALMDAGERTIAWVTMTD